MGVPAGALVYTSMAIFWVRCLSAVGSMVAVFLLKIIRSYCSAGLRTYWATWAEALMPAGAGLAASGV